jgi:pyrroline-5-carboxylate reductase
MSQTPPARLPVLLIGGGRMGRALVKGWLKFPDIGPIVVVDPSPTPELLGLVDDHRVQLVAGDLAVGALAHIENLNIVLAVKPQMFATALPAYRGLAQAGTLVLSIAAGKTLADLGQIFGKDAGLIRAMPNTPAEIGLGMSALYTDHDTAPDIRARAQRLLDAVGQTAWLSHESDMDAVTALSGSGPAYVFLLVEELASAGTALGLSPALAMTLARQMVIGAGGLLGASAENAASLRQSVTSPAGTTAAALAVLMAQDGLSPLIRRAVEAACQRSRALAG